MSRDTAGKAGDLPAENSIDNTVTHLNKIERMKKEYTAPSMEAIEIKVSAMLATSMDISNDIVTSDQQLGRDDNNYGPGHPSNPNLWEQSW